jgi:hypothetical protein
VKLRGTVGAFVLSFGQDADGGLYVLTSGLPGPMGNTGKVFRFVPVETMEVDGVFLERWRHDE